MRKKETNMKTLKQMCYLLMAAMLVTTNVACGDESPEPNGNGGEQTDPTKPVPDPEGTIAISMLNDRSTEIGDVEMNEANNFKLSSGNIASIGTVKGLGNVDYIPTTGWAREVAVRPGNGYVVAENAYPYDGTNYTFTRIYVEDWITGITGGIIGADVKYQKPFYGAKAKIQVEKTSYSMDADQESLEIPFQNKSYVAFDVQATGCTVEKMYSSESGIKLSNGVKINLGKNRSTAERKAKVVISNKSIDQTVEINITQKAGTPSLTLSADTVYFTKNAGTYNLPFEGFAVPTPVSSADWCKVSLAIVDETGQGTLDIASEYTTEDRTATITFPGLDKKLVVVQSKYAVGDEYSEGKITGKVCIMNQECRIIYQTLEETTWSTLNVFIGADNEYDGRENTKKIMTQKDWSNNYPAMAVVNSLNTDGVSGWYMPAYKELQGASLNSLTVYYWSSTECGSGSAYSTYGSSGNSNSKSRRLPVIAVHQF